MKTPIGALALVLLAATGASAAPLVRPDPHAPRALARDRAQRLVVDAGALAELRGKRSAILDDFPLGRDGTATLDVHRVEPFGPDTRVEEVTPSGVQQVPLPDEVYFAGQVRGDDASRVLLIAAADGVRGFVVRGDQTYPFGPDAAGHHRVYAMRDVDPAQHPAPRDFCANDLHPERPELSVPVLRNRAVVPLVPVHSTTLLEAQVAIDTDTELRSKFGSRNAELSYLTSLLAAANVIYERDVNVRLRFSYVRIWSGSDPWTATDTVDSLDEVQAYWLNPGNDMDTVAGAHDMVHFISGKPVTGGVAYLSAVCDHTYGFGVSQVFGSFNVSDPNAIWDVLVVTHELGHNVGTPHTHCYSPPLDQCYNGEPGCYSGPESVPPGGGTIMSYCHLLAPGLPNVNLLFGPTVSATIRSTVESASCMTAATSCGDGTLDPGEQCDDGNFISGDGCSSACQLETTCGNHVIDPGEQCDDGNTVAGDGCSDTCQYETVCGDGIKEGIEECDDGNTVAADGCSPTCHLEICGNAILDPGETCDDGNTSGNDGCTPTCHHEPLCGDGALDPGEECDDGNKKSDDGCDKSCHLEPCQVLIPHQTTWAPAKIVATPSRFSLRARFGVSSSVFDPATVANAGVRIMVDGVSGTRAVDVTVPGGGGWNANAARARYRNPGGTAGGVRGIVIRGKEQGVTTIDLKLTSQGGAVPSLDDVPPTVTVLLGGDAGGPVGACGHYAFPGALCVKRGKRLVCK
ncbi:MAG TPA: DUF4215 domain-containing protein [Candidatus Eisenbacteria bacterium]|nr:DUF4215 domain-containing protein [Candidatus Eisenbacteria bacterium]